MNLFYIHISSAIDSFVYLGLRRYFYGVLANEYEMVGYQWKRMSTLNDIYTYLFMN